MHWHGTTTAVGGATSRLIDPADGRFDGVAGTDRRLGTIGLGLLSPENDVAPSAEDLWIPLMRPSSLLSNQITTQAGVIVSAFSDSSSPRRVAKSSLPAAAKCRAGEYFVCSIPLRDHPSGCIACVRGHFTLP